MNDITLAFIELKNAREESRTLWQAMVLKLLLTRG